MQFRKTTSRVAICTAIFGFTLAVGVKYAFAADSWAITSPTPGQIIVKNADLVASGSGPSNGHTAWLRYNDSSGTLVSTPKTVTPGGPPCAMSWLWSTTLTVPPGMFSGGWPSSGTVVLYTTTDPTGVNYNSKDVIATVSVN